MFSWGFCSAIVLRYGALHFRLQGIAGKRLREEGGPYGLDLNPAGLLPFIGCCVSLMNQVGDSDHWN